MEQAHSPPLPPPPPPSLSTTIIRPRVLQVQTQNFIIIITILIGAWIIIIIVHPFSIALFSVAQAAQHALFILFISIFSIQFKAPHGWKLRSLLPINGRFWLDVKTITLLLTFTVQKYIYPSVSKCACWVFSCYRDPPKSDMDYRIFNVRTRSSYACVYTHGGWAHRQRVSTTFVTPTSKTNMFKSQINEVAAACGKLLRTKSHYFVCLIDWAVSWSLGLHDW